MLANPITLKNHFEKEKDELNIPDYLVKITKFSTSSRQAIEYSKLIYDLYVKRELIKISENVIKLGELVKNHLQAHPISLITELRGLGLMLGFQVDAKAVNGIEDFQKTNKTPALFLVEFWPNQVY